MRGKQFHTGIEVNVWAIACFAHSKGAIEKERNAWVIFVMKLSYGWICMVNFPRGFFTSILNEKDRV